LEVAEGGVNAVLDSDVVSPEYVGSWPMG
jgi:hypothetical protein